MDSQLRLHSDNLSLFVEPKFKRQTVGYYSRTSEREYKPDDSEKASLVALKEVAKTSQGIAEYEVPAHIEQLSLNEGYEMYNDDYDDVDQSDLVRWLKAHPKDCLDVDVVSTQRTISKIFRAPYTEATATPWEIRVTRGPDGICYLEEDQNSKLEYAEMNNYAKQQYFRQKSFQRYMTIKKGIRNKCLPPSDHSNAFYRVNKLELDAGLIVYQSEIQCFDINYNAIDLKARQEGQYDLPPPISRLSWWGESYLAGTNTILCGYYDDEDENTLQRLVSFDIKHVKPRIIRDQSFDDEICIGSLCTFVQFIKDMTVDGTVETFLLRFEPGSKRVCVLDVVTSEVPITEGLSFSTQVSATDETSSVEVTPRTTRDEDEEDRTTKKANGTAESGIPRLRRVDRQDSQAPGAWLKRRNTLTTEMGANIVDQLQELVADNDDDKYGEKRRGKNKLAEEDDLNWQHVGILFIFIAIAFIGIPWTIQWFGHAAPY